MRKFLASLLAVCFFFALFSVASAEDSESKEYYISEIGITITLPTDFMVFTKDTPFADETYQAFLSEGLDMQSILTDTGFSLYAVNPDGVVLGVWQESSEHSEKIKDYRFISPARFEKTYRKNLFKQIKLGQRTEDLQGIVTNLLYKETIQGDSFIAGTYQTDFMYEDGSKKGTYTASTILSGNELFFEIVGQTESLQPMEIVLLNDVLASMQVDVAHNFYFEAEQEARKNKFENGSAGFWLMIGMVVAPVILFFALFAIGKRLFKRKKSKPPKQAIHKNVDPSPVLASRKKDYYDSPEI